MKELVRKGGDTDICMWHIRLVKKVALIAEALWPSMLCIVFISALWSGYWYQYNGDEVLHTQMSYLISIGKTPFIDYFSIYTPLFHWLIVPTVVAFQSAIGTLHALRIEMMLLYVIDLFCLFITLRFLFGRVAAWTGIALLLLDPFTTFAGMQIRPDSLMLTLFCAGLVCTISAFQKKGFIWSGGAGVLMGLSLLTAVKIAPAVLPVCIVSFFLLTGPRRWIYSAGFFLPWILFLGYLLSRGMLATATMQVTVDIGYLSAAILHPTRFGFFYLPDNVYIYGVGGKPLTWVFVLVLPVLGMFGGLVTLIKRSSLIGMALAVGMVLSFVSLLIPSTAFIQYYVPSYWLFALFAGVFIDQVYKKVPTFIRPVALVLACMVYMAVAVSAVEGNVSRATMNWHDQDELYTRYWKRIPQGNSVFPGYLFRPSVHPLINGYFMGDMPPVIRQQFILPEVSLEASHVPYIFLNESALMTYEPSTQAYIRTHYERMPDDEQLLVRITE